MPESRPLYIQPREPARLRLEGPSLTFHQPGQADHWLPLARVSRIALNQNVSIDTDAILACARRGITLLIHDQEQQLIARIVGQGRHRTGLRQRLLDLTERPDWRERYADWLHANRRRIAAIVASRLDAPVALGRDAGAIARWSRHTATVLVGEQAARLSRRVFQRHALAWMQQTLAERGIDAGSESWLVGDPDLARQLADLLALRLEPSRLDWLAAIARRGGVKGRLSQRAVVAKLEARRQPIGRLGRDIVNRLHTWLVEIA